MTAAAEAVLGVTGHKGRCKVCGWRSEIGRANIRLALADVATHDCSGPEGGPIVVGIDPAITHTGILVIRPGSATAITATSDPLGKGERDPHLWSARIERTAAKVAGEIPLGSTVAIEGPAHGAKFGNPDERAGLRWSIIARLRWRGCRIVVIPPTSAKMWLTNSGTADKRAMISAARTLAPEGLGIKTEHEADAFALASMLAARLGVPVMEPRTRGDEALAKVSWGTIGRNEK